MAEATAQPTVAKVVEKEEKPKLPPLPPVKKNAKQFTIKADKAAGALLSFDELPIKRGESRGTVYYAPLSVSIDDLVKAYGEENVMDAFIRPRMKLLFQNLVDEATDDDGIFNEEEFLKLANELSARGESIKELFARQSELAEEMTQYDFSNPEHLPILQRIAKQMKSVRDGIKQKKRKTKEDQEAEAAQAKVAAA